VGLEFHDPKTFWDGTVHGSVYMDFFAGTAPLGQTFRLRTGSIQIDWKTTSLMVGQEKPIFNPREPSSLAQVGISPLTGAGNLWLWIPQVRVEQDFSFGAATGLRARMGVVETHEVPPYENTAVPGGLAPARPGLEGRFEFFHNLDGNRKLEIAPGFHSSVTHAGGVSIPSNLFSLDWFFNPWRRLEFSGAFYSGQNVANLGTGQINQGYSLYRVAWRRRVPVWRAVSSSFTTWTTTGSWKSRRDFTPASRMLGALPFLPTCFRWTGFSIPGGGWNSREPFTPARMSPTWAPGRSTRAIACTGVVEEPSKAGADGAS